MTKQEQEMREVDTELLTEMYLDVDLGKSFEEAGYVDELRPMWDTLTAEVEEIKANGGTVELPFDIPNIGE